MGRPYAEDLRALPQTYHWAMESDIGLLTDAVGAASSLPLFAVGSGGSLTAAYYAAMLHQQYAGIMAKAATPLEAVVMAPGYRNAVVLLLTASGENSDILGVFRHLVVREPRRFVVACARKSSRLAMLATKFRYVDYFDFDLPSGKDGFLATNSLLAFSVLLLRAYLKVFPAKAELPPALDGLVHPGQTGGNWDEQFQMRVTSLWSRENLVVLFGPTTQAAAVDLESKFTEAALGTVQIADYRNFAHGRHHWLAKRGQTSAVLALIAREDALIAQRTLDLIPSDIPAVKVDLALSGALAGLAALVWAMKVVGHAGHARGIDPGRPGVPAFGRRIYRLRALGQQVASGRVLSLQEAAIERKARHNVAVLNGLGLLAFWRGACRRFVCRIAGCEFQAVVLDYDGTLCDSRDRFQGWRGDIAAQVVRLLDAGLLIGVATGRGRSVREDLRREIPKHLWPRLVVGYYNGGDRALLSDDAHPVRGRPKGGLLAVAKTIRRDPILKRVAQCDCRTTQISIVPKAHWAEAAVKDAVQRIISAFASGGLTAVCSSHSVDILAAGVSKRTLVGMIRERLKTPDGRILCIGDSGRWPGNDFDLLSEEHSLSVDEVSSAPETCWNLAPPGYRGPQAAMYYLESLQPTGSTGSVRLRLKSRGVTR